MIGTDEAWKEFKSLYLDLQEEIETLEVSNDANIGDVAKQGHIASALNGSVKRLRKLMERADELEVEIMRE